jgi:hypothetical protein
MFGMMAILIISYSEAADGKYETFNEANSPQFLLQVVEAFPWLVTPFCGWQACLVCTSSTHCQSSAMGLQISRIPFMDHTHHMFTMAWALTS